MALSPPDPTESNVPYLAWRGEQVRFVKCHPSISPTGAGQRADFLLVDWSGEEHALAVPQLEPGTGGFFAATGPDHAGQGCVAADFSSQKAGIGQIKLVVSSVPTGGGAVGASITGPVGTPILKHDYLGIWMNLNTPVLSAGNAACVGDGPCTTNAADLIETAGSGRNNFRVDVTGNVPLRANFRELGIGDSVTLPNDWARLAGVLATVFTPDDTNPATRWDIHDDRSADLVHGTQTENTYCGTRTVITATDAVDNCPQFTLTATGAFAYPLNGRPPELGAFSRIWSTPTNPTIGPFDPLVPSQTYLSNGRLDANDAPMPAARVDFEILPNTGAAGDIGGGGFFGCVGTTAVLGTGGAGCLTLNPTCTGTAITAPNNGPNCLAKDKHIIYSRDGTGTQATTVADTHNLYAPFYGRFIPSTSRSCNLATPGCDGFLGTTWTGVAEASGEDGPAGSVIGPTSAGGGFIGVPGGTNDFNGWLVNGLYHYWDIARVLRNAVAGNSGCLLRNDANPAQRQTPSGPQNVAVYTDEHGEAHVWWYPGIGFFFGGLGIAGNLNLGCELQGVNPIARSTVRATARYPYQPVTDAPKVSNTITKTINSLFNKRLQCVPKGTNPNDQFSQICIIEARDITGSAAPFVGEIVCFATNAELIQRFSGVVPLGGGVTVPQILPGSPGSATGPPIAVNPADIGKAGAAVLCSRLDAAGRAAVEVFGKGASNLIADLVNEGLIRVITFNFATGTGATGTAEATAPVTSTTVPTPAQVAAVNNSTGTQVVNGAQTVTNAAGSKPEVTLPSAKPAVQARLMRAELIRPVKAKPYMLVRVNANVSSVKITIRMDGKSKTVATVTRTIKANTLVKVTGLKIPASVQTLRVSVAS